MGGQGEPPFSRVPRRPPAALCVSRQDGEHRGTDGRAAFGPAAPASSPAVAQRCPRGAVRHLLRDGSDGQRRSSGALRLYTCLPSGKAADRMAPPAAGPAVVSRYGRDIDRERMCGTGRRSGIVVSSVHTY